MDALATVLVAALDAHVIDAVSRNIIAVVIKM